MAAGPPWPTPKALGQLDLCLYCGSLSLLTLNME